MNVFLAPTREKSNNLCNCKAPSPVVNGKKRKPAAATFTPLPGLRWIY
jgi:hypothetical protein